MAPSLRGPGFGGPGVVVGSGTAAASCGSMPTTDAAAIAKAPVAFVGTVAFTTDEDGTAYFTVDEVWRGPELTWMTVVHGRPFGPNSISSVDRTWVRGTRYLVLPSRGRDGELVDISCSATAPYKSSFDAIRPAVVRPPQSVPLPIGAAVVLAGAIAFAVWGRVRHTRAGASHGQSSRP
jgi:hypothetical protein